MRAGKVCPLSTQTDGLARTCVIGIFVKRDTHHFLTAAVTHRVGGGSPHGCELHRVQIHQADNLVQRASRQRIRLGNKLTQNAIQDAAPLVEADAAILQREGVDRVKN